MPDFSASLVKNMASIWAANNVEERSGFAGDYEIFLYGSRLPAKQAHGCGRPCALELVRPICEEYLRHQVKISGCILAYGLVVNLVLKVLKLTSDKNSNRINK